jgi:Cof subfamily protein (haloacid dehalogenase superfamily)
MAAVSSATVPVVLERAQHAPGAFLDPAGERVLGRSSGVGSSGVAAPAAPTVIVTDLDGTLLDEDGRLSRRNAAVLRRAQEAGTRVVIATGRPIWWLGPVVEAGFTGVAVCLNGAITYDVGRREVLGTAPLAPKVMQRFAADLDAATDRIGVAVERLGTDASCCWAEPAYEHPWIQARFRIADRAEVLSEPAAKMLVRGRSDSRSLAATARRVGGDDVSITWSTDAGMIEVAAGGVNKGTALDRLVEQWGVDPADAIAFGDMPNDLELLRWAGHGVAMAGGHPELQAAADEIAPEHFRDGVAAVLERWF